MTMLGIINVNLDTSILNAMPIVVASHVPDSLRRFENTGGWGEGAIAPQPHPPFPGSYAYDKAKAMELVKAIVLELWHS